MKTRLIIGLLMAAVLPGAPFLINVNTTALNTQTGTIDIQFNPGGLAPYEAGTATVTAFDLGTGSLGSIAAGPDGGASGSLPGPLVIVNSDFFNGIVYNGTFGTAASFTVEFAGNAFTVLGQTVVSNFSATFTGTTTSIVASADLIGGGLIDISFSSPEVTFTEVPEPSTMALLGLGLALGAAARRLSRG